MWPFPKLSQGDTGQQVKTAQYLLLHNRYKVAFLHGTADGDFGPLTETATNKAKYVLGFKKSNINGVFGPDLYSFLVPLNYAHAQRRSPAMHLRAKVRAGRIVKTTREKALDLALTQVGTREFPAYSNLNPYGAWLGDNGVPWCAIFVSWCFSHVGHPMSEINVGVIHQKASAHQGSFDVVSRPIPGDLCCMNFGSPDEHIGIFMRGVDGSHFEMVSGNTGLTSLANGGEVLTGVFPYGQCDAFVRVL